MFVRDVSGGDHVVRIEFIKKRVFGVVGEMRLLISPGPLQSTQKICDKCIQSSPSSFTDLPTPQYPQQELLGAIVESNIAYTLRFTIDTEVVDMNWIEVPRANREWSKISRILSFDIECADRKGIFPEANQDLVMRP